MGSSEIFALRKQGRPAEALERARDELSRNENDIWFLRAYAWAIYDHVKKIVDDYEGNHLSASAMSNKITPFMEEFSRMGSPLRGDSAFSQILRLAGKVSSNWHDFLAFAQWAGIDGFSDEDIVPFVNDRGRKIDSLQKRFTRAICREAVSRSTDPSADPDLIAWGRKMLQASLDQDPNDQWLNYYQSKLYLKEGDSDQAVERLLTVLRRQSKAAWTWALLGNILKDRQFDDAIVCLAYATQLARDEQEIAKVRIQLAALLALSERYGEAAQQTKLALQYREEHGYKIPSELNQLVKSDWFDMAKESGKMEPLSEASVDAKNLLQKLEKKNLTFSVGAIDHVNQEKRLTYVATASDDGVVLLHREFPDIVDIFPGTIVEVGQTHHDGPAMDWRLSKANSIPGLCDTFSGEVERHQGRSFAFLRSTKGDVFIPPYLAHEFSPDLNYSRSCVALRRANKRGEVGWRAVRFVASHDTSRELC